MEQQHPNPIDDLLPDAPEFWPWRARKPVESDDSRCLGTHQVGLVAMRQFNSPPSGALPGWFRQFLPVFHLKGWGRTYLEAVTMANKNELLAKARLLKTPCL